MATATKTCRVCGKEYEYCHTNKTVACVFRWQDVSCSPSCGSVYLARILESRGQKPVKYDIAANGAEAGCCSFDLVNDKEHDEPKMELKKKATKRNKTATSE